MFWGIREGDVGYVLIVLGRALVQTILFHYSLKLRASLGRLPDNDLNNFLVETLFKGGFQTLGSVLFILFRSLKCNIERGTETCTTNTSCASFISLMLIINWVLKLVHGSIKSEWRRELSISMEKIARMKISWRQAAEGLLLAVMAGCGAFLFALMSAKEPDWSLVASLGLIGLVAGVACIVSEIYTVTKEHRRRREGQSQVEQPGTVPRDELVEACSWWYVAACFAVTTIYTILYTIFAITLADWSWRAANLLAPIAGTCWVLAVFLRPKDEGAGLKIQLLQFFIFAIGSEVATAVGNFQGSYTTFSAWAALARIPFWLITYWLGLKLKREAAQLPPADLSKFLCHIVLLGGVSAMAPMTFFMFEAVSCMASGDGLGDDQCENTAIAAMCLSCFLAVIIAVGIASRTVPQEERGEGMTYSNLAILRLKMKEKVQGALGVVTALLSMYLFSVLGVEGERNRSLGWVGLGGGVTLLVAGLIEAASIAFGRAVSTGNGQAGPSSVSLGQPSNLRRSRSASIGNIAENMSVAGLVQISKIYIFRTTNQNFVTVSASSPPLSSHSSAPTPPACPELSRDLERRSLPPPVRGPLVVYRELVPLDVGQVGRPVEGFGNDERLLYGVLLAQVVYDLVLRGDEVRAVDELEDANLVEGEDDVLGHDAGFLAYVNDADVAPLLVLLEIVHDGGDPIRLVGLLSKVRHGLLRAPYLLLLLREQVREGDEESAVALPLVAREREDASEVVTDVRVLPEEDNDGDGDDVDEVSKAGWVEVEVEVGVGVALTVLTFSFE